MKENKNAKAENEKDGSRERHHLIRKFGYAFRGITEAISIDNSFKYHFAAGIIAVIAGFVLRISEAEWIAVVIAITVVLITEMFNTVCEIMMRIYTNEYHELVKKLLDISAGAVLFASIAALVVGIIIFGNNFHNLLDYFGTK